MTPISQFLKSAAITLADVSEAVAESSSEAGGLDFGDFTAKIFPNIWATIIQFLALIAMIIIFFIFGYKPVKKLITKRQNYIEKQIQDAQESNKGAQENYKQSQVTLLETRKKVDEMIETGKKQVILEQQNIIEATNKEVAKMKLDADKDIERKKLQAQEEVRKQIVDVALLASSELLKRETNTKDNEKLVQQFIDDMDKEDGNN